MKRLLKVKAGTGVANDVAKLTASNIYLTTFDALDNHSKTLHYSSIIYECSSTLQDFLKTTWTSSLRTPTWKQYVINFTYLTPTLSIFELDITGTGLVGIQGHTTETRQCQPGLFRVCVPPLPVCGISLPVCCPLKP